jgi:hypothetical protein
MSNLLSQASLVMIPSGYKEDIVYSQIPTSGAGDLSFTRASNGTRVNSAGLVEDCPWNLLEQSETFDNAVWSKTGVTVTANSVAAPNGTTTADTLVFGASSNEIVQSVGNLIVDQTYTLTIYLRVASGTATMYWGNIDYTTPSITVTTEWQRFTVTQQAAATTRYPKLVSSSGVTIYAWGAQVNIGSTAKPYFPTTDRLNVPRLTYQNGGGGCPSLLLEKQSTNLALQSQSFISPWAIGNYLGTNPVITQNYGISPDGTQNAVRIQLARTNSNDSYSQVYQYPISVSVGQQYTWSVYLKSLSGTPTISIVGDFGRPPVTLTSEWVRYTGTGTATASQTQLEIAILGSNYATGNSLSADFLAYGYQIEQSSYPTSYIPTTSASATRVADACYKTGISSLIGQTQGTLFVDVTEEAQNNGRYIFVSDGSATNRVVIYQAGGVINVYCSAGATFNLTYSPPAGRLKIAFVYKSGDYALWVNGVQRATSTETAVPTGLSATGIGSNENSIGTPEPIDAGVNQAILFPTRLTNAELASLTTI